MNCSRSMMSLATVLVLIASSAVILAGNDISDADDQTWYDAQVTPFTFPESDGAPLMEALEQAESTIDISIYILTSSNVLSLLLEKQKQGVKVRITVDGQPEKNTLADYPQIHVLRNIVDEGGEVHVIDYEGCSEEDAAFEYFHNKYAVVDGKITVITSENWTLGNFDDYLGNRGWGVVIESTGFAQYMEGVFTGDFSLERADVKELLAVYPELTAYTGKLGYEISNYATTTYSAKVTPVIAPDNAWESVRSLMNSATSRLYCEEMSLEDEFIDGTLVESPYTWMIDASKRGVDTRFITYTNDDTPENQKQTSKVKYLNENTSVAASGSPVTDKFEFMHNKGIIADDKVLVGSVNWTYNSFYNNREVAVIIDSKEVSDYFTKPFLWDLYTGEGTCAGKDTCRITYDIGGTDTVLTYLKGDKVILPDTPTKSSQSVYTYTFSHWDGYSEGMVADEDITLTAVFDRHTILEDYGWYVYIVAALGVLAALSLGCWYIRHGR